MTQLLKEIQHNKLLWLLIFVPVVFAAEALGPKGGGQLGMQDLDGDLALVPDVGREEDGRHAALSELALDRVAVGKLGFQSLQDTRHVR